MPFVFGDVSPAQPLSGTALTVLLAALGLSSAAGFRAYLPLLAVGVASDVPTLGGSQLLPLQQQFQPLGNPGVLVLLGVLAVAELILDKIPVVDHLNDLVHTAIRPLIGAVIMAGTANTLSDINPWIAALAGGVLALLVHATKAGTRHAVTATTVGMGNPVVSLIEDVLVIVSVILLVSFPILGFILLVAVIILMWKALRWMLRGVRRLFGGSSRGKAAPSKAVASKGTPAPKVKAPKKAKVQAKAKVPVPVGAALPAPALPAVPVVPPVAPKLSAGAGLAIGGVSSPAGAVVAGAVPADPEAAIPVVPTPPTATTPTMPTVADPDAPPFATAAALPPPPILPPAHTQRPPMPTMPYPGAAAVPYPEDAKTLPASYRRPSRQPNDSHSAPTQQGS